MITIDDDNGIKGNFLFLFKMTICYWSALLRWAFAIALTSTCQLAWLRIQKIQICHLMGCFAIKWIE